MRSSTTSSSAAARLPADPVRVLLVDDNDDILARAASVLRSGCAIVGAMKDGVSALEAARALRPDVIVLDISMPGMTGFEVAARLAESGSAAAVVFLTVHDDEELKQAAEAAGAAGYVVKPRLASDLLIAVCEARARRLGAQSMDPRSRRANPPEPEH